MISIKELRNLVNTRSEQDIWLSNMLYRIELNQGFDDTENSTNITDKEFKELVKVFDTVDAYISTLNKAKDNIINYIEPSKEVMDKLETTKKVLDKHPEIYIDTDV